MFRLWAFMGMMTQVCLLCSSPGPHSASFTASTPPPPPAAGPSSAIREPLPERNLRKRRRVDLPHHRPAHRRADVRPRLLRPAPRRRRVAGRALAKRSDT